jgi:glycine cleavage system regulatory protein
MKTLSRPEPESGTPIYTMRVEMGVPASIELAALEADLDRIAEELRIDVTVRAQTPVDL